MFLLFIFFSPFRLLAQPNIVADSIWQQKQVKNAISYARHQLSGANSPVYQGYEYVPYVLPVSGTPFYLSNDWQKGNVQLDGSWYFDLNLLYDIYKDQLVLQSPDKMYRIALPLDKVSDFTLGDHKFTRILHDNSARKANPATGYYEILFADTDSLLVHRSKIVNVPTQPGMSRNYQPVDRYFIQKDGEYFEVSTKKSVLRTLNDKRSALKKFIRQNDINYRHGKEDAIIEMLRYYDQLKK